MVRDLFGATAAAAAPPPPRRSFELRQAQTLQSASDRRNARQLRTFTAWWNTYLASMDLATADLCEDIKPGVLSFRLLEALSNSRLSFNHSPRGRSQELENHRLLLDHLSKAGVALSSTADDLAQGVQEHVLALTWALIQRYEIHEHGASEDLLLAWARTVVAQYGVSLEGGWSSGFNDGLAFSAIAHDAMPAAMDMSAATRLAPDPALLTAVFMAADMHLGVPALLDASDFADDDHVDVKSVMLYVAKLKQRHDHMLRERNRPKPLKMVGKIFGWLSGDEARKRAVARAAEEVAAEAAAEVAGAGGASPKKPLVFSSFLHTPQKTVAVYQQSVPAEEAEFRFVEESYAKLADAAAKAAAEEEGLAKAAAEEAAAAEVAISQARALAEKAFAAEAEAIKAAAAAASIANEASIAKVAAAKAADEARVAAVAAASVPPPTPTSSSTIQRIRKAKARRLNASTTMASGAPDAEVSLFDSHDDELNRELKIGNAYAGWGAGVGANDMHAMVDLGVNLVRREGENYDVGVGLHADTGAEVSKERIKFYLFGLGGEAKFDAKGKLKSFGLGLSVLKLNMNSTKAEAAADVEEVEVEAKAEAAVDRADAAADDDDDDDLAV